MKVQLLDFSGELATAISVYLAVEIVCGRSTRAFASTKSLSLCTFVPLHGFRTSACVAGCSASRPTALRLAKGRRRRGKLEVT